MTSFVLAALTVLQINSHALTVTTAVPLQSSVPLGAQRVSMQMLTLQASCAADVKVNTIKVTHSGLGAAADIERVYAMEGIRRISRTASLTNVPATATVRFPNLVIPKCEKRTVSIMADFSVDAVSQSEHRLGIASLADISASTTDIGGTVGGSATGPTRIAPVSQGTIEVEYLPVLTSTTYGAARTLMRLRLTARDEDQFVYSITLTNDGKARDTDLQRLSLGTRSLRLTDIVPSMTGDTVTLTFEDPLRLDRGEDILLLLTGDVRASRRRTIDFEVQEASDITAGTAARSTTSQ